MGNQFLIFIGGLGILLSFLFFNTSHIITEGHIGIYTRGGALLPQISDPGLHTMIPFLDRMHEIQITIQTDKVQNIPCGTSGGVMIYFDKVEVVNRLRKDLAHETIKNYTSEYDKTWIFNKIHHEINQFCSSHSLTEVYITKFDQLDEYLKEQLQKGCSQWAPGIEIIAVRVTKPQVPYHILQNYEQMEAEKAKYLIAKESQKVSAKKSETQKLLAKIKAQEEQEVSKINMQKKMLEQEANQKIQNLNNNINFEKNKQHTEAFIYRQNKEIEINKEKLSLEFMKESVIKNIKKLEKVYYGKSIPQYLNENIKLLNSIE